MKLLLFAWFILLSLVAVQAQTKMKIYLSDHLVPCGINDEPRNCLQMKESKKADWQTFYNPIQGFEYAEGYAYKLLVQATYHDTKQADGFNLSYKLLKQLSKKKTTYNPLVKLDGKKWLMLSMQDGQSNLVTTDTSTYLRFSVAANTMSGSSVCNQFFSTVQVQGNSITFSAIGSTRKFCEASSTQIESIILGLLAQVNTYVLLGNRLTLTTPAGATLVFEAQ